MSIRRALKELADLSLPGRAENNKAKLIGAPSNCRQRGSRKLSDRERAKQHLVSLEAEPKDTAALSLAGRSGRRGRTMGRVGQYLDQIGTSGKRPRELKDLFLRLGCIYQEKIPTRSELSPA